MITLHKNKVNQVVVPRGDLDLAQGAIFVIGITTPSGASYFVYADDQSTRNDFAYLTFRENLTGVDPAMGIVNLPFEGECTLAVYRTDAFSTNTADLKLAIKERARLCH